MEKTADDGWSDMPLPPIHHLTGDPGRRLCYRTDPMVREGWATLVGVLGEGEALRFASGTALAWLRPDAAAAGALADVVEQIARAGFMPMGACVVQLTRAEVRALWWWQLKRATAERLLLLDAVAELGPGLLVLYRHSGGDPARRLTQLKGGNDPAGRPANSLRSVAGSPNRVLTMVHTSDDPLDVVRELAVFLPWRERAALVASAWARDPYTASPVLDGPLAAVRSAYARRPDVSDVEPEQAPSQRGEAFAALLRDITAPEVERRWAAVETWSHRVPLLIDGASR
ncbi:nucleoside-diphosphate kinase [Streptomyces sp. MS1.AVA.3]|uniref:nucleoside-diphosphate kinase n=1 Tax=Streptomyces decoyicus TaxID=249567 RepID=UPI0030BF08B5